MQFPTFLALFSLVWLGVISCVQAVPGFQYVRSGTELESTTTPLPIDNSSPSSGSGSDSGLAKRTSCGVATSMEKRGQDMSRFRRMRKSFRAPGVVPTPVTIPVHMFIIAENRTIQGGWVPDTQIEDQIAILNNDFANAYISWQLVNVTRVLSTDWFRNANDNAPEREMKSFLRMGGVDTLNIYTVELTTNLFGYATFPADYEDDPVSDGIVMNYRTMPGGSLRPFNEGRTLTHEVGHWVGLYHTFVEEGDREREGCDGDGDFVNDTPPQLIPTSGCVPQDSCQNHAGLDPMNNFMDYSDDACMQEFTPGQVQRMRDEIEVWRGIEF